MYNPVRGEGLSIPGPTRGGALIHGPANRKELSTMAPPMRKGYPSLAPPRGGLSLRSQAQVMSVTGCQWGFSFPQSRDRLNKIPVNHEGSLKPQTKILHEPEWQQPGWKLTWHLPLGFWENPALTVACGSRDIVTDLLIRPLPGQAVGSRNGSSPN